MITIRKARIMDLDSLSILWKEFFKELDHKIVSGNPLLRPHLAKKSEAPKLFREFVKKQIMSKNGIVFLAEVDAKLAGYCLSFIKKNIVVFKIGWYGYISDLYIRKEFRRKNISSMFKDEAMKWFKKKGIKHASIMVHTQNRRAHRIYSNWGFQDDHIDMRMTI